MGGGRRHSSDSNSSSSDDTDSSSTRNRKTTRSRNKERQRRRKKRTRSHSSSGDSVSNSRRKTSKRSSRRKDRRKSKSPPVDAQKSRSVSVERSGNKSRSRRSRSRSASRGSGNMRSQRSTRKSRSPSIEEIRIKTEKSSILALNVKSEDDNRRGGSAASESKTQITLDKSVKLTVSEQMNRALAIDEINASGFEQRDFKSGRSTATAAETQNRQIDDHDIVMFGTSAEAKNIVMTAAVTSGLVNTIVPDKGQIAHENLYGDQAAKQERWIRRLHSMRQKKLNGEAMT